MPLGAFSYKLLQWKNFIEDRRYLTTYQHQNLPAAVVSVFPTYLHPQSLAASQRQLVHGNSPLHWWQSRLYLFYCKTLLLSADCIWLFPLSLSWSLSPHQVFVSLYPDLKTCSSFEIYHDPAMYNKKKIKFPFIDKLTTSFLVLNKKYCFVAPFNTLFLTPVPFLFFSHTHLFTYFSSLSIRFYHFPPNSHLFSPSFPTVFILFSQFLLLFLPLFTFQIPSFPIPFLLCSTSLSVPILFSPSSNIVCSISFQSFFQS